MNNIEGKNTIYNENNKARFKMEEKKAISTTKQTLIIEFDDLNTLENTRQSLKTLYYNYNLSRRPITEPFCRDRIEKPSDKLHKKSPVCAYQLQEYNFDYLNSEYKKLLKLSDDLIEEGEEFNNNLTDLFEYSEDLSQKGTCFALYDASNNYKVNFYYHHLRKNLLSQRKYYNLIQYDVRDHASQLLELLKEYIKNEEQWRKITAKNLKLIVSIDEVADIKHPKYTGLNYELLLRLRMAEHFDRIIDILEAYQMQNDNSDIAKEVSNAIHTVYRQTQKVLDYARLIEECHIDHSIDIKELKDSSEDMEKEAKVPPSVYPRTYYPSEITTESMLRPGMLNTTETITRENFHNVSSLEEPSSNNNDIFSNLNINSYMIGGGVIIGLLTLLNILICWFKKFKRRNKK
ncbi:hypothetical protein NGRA_1724 [Nosema granulosis]|uniref:Uncharacterized protein n=1 Tax=Nosema granulosis TaxID=83296 RepID=A0A9P6H0N9_9MICR|nr:hypothetical protein NGRA_1724 [Nosema granulosis]